VAIRLKTAAEWRAQERAVRRKHVIKRDLPDIYWDAERLPAALALGPRSFHRFMARERRKYAQVQAQRAL
jgi:hypothetical protein